MFVFRVISEIKTKAALQEFNLKLETYFHMKRIVNIIAENSIVLNLSFLSSKIKNVNFHQVTDLVVCSYYATYVFESECTLYSCLNAKELLAPYSQRSTII